jgi:peptide deformylase
MGNPVLRKVAEKVQIREIKTDGFGQLVEDLRDSMKHYGGIGIAAPQIGISLQVCVIELNNINRYGQEINLPFTVFINPEIEYVTQDRDGYWEGCLSVPGLRGYVERPNKVRVTYYNEKAEKKVIEGEGFLATVLQHELDHLFGTLYIDRVSNPTLLSYQEEYDEFIIPGASLD